MDNYGTPPIALVRGRGARVWDADGREYVDLVAGIAVNALGHAHPAVVAAVSEQVATLGHTSNLVVNAPAVQLAERLLTLAGRDGRVFFCNSGAEANEAAFKLARLTGRQRVVVAEGSFHGRTMGALALTAQPAKQDPFRPLPGDVVAVPFGDIDALRAAVDDSGLGGLPRTDPGRGRRRAGSARLPRGSGRGRALGRGVVRAGRGADRDRPDRRVVRPPERRHRAGHRDPGQGARRRPADRRA